MSKTTRNHTLTAAELFRANLARLLAARDMSLYRLSLESGIAYANVHGLANGDRVPQLETLDRLAAFFGVPVSAFFRPPKKS